MGYLEIKFSSKIILENTEAAAIGNFKLFTFLFLYAVAFNLYKLFLKPLTFALITPNLRIPNSLSIIQFSAFHVK